jgi:anaerobic magnesium-protoporphyrin IX monomethyl ester cyclase
MSGGVLFGQSYYLRFDPKLWRAMQPYPPLGTLYAASCLRARGHEVALFDAMLAPSEAEWEDALARHRPRWAVLYEDNFNYLSKMCLLRMRQAAFTMIDAARRAGAEVLVCGSDATDHAEKYLAAGARFVLNGEGEETLAELMDRLDGRSGVPLEEVRGLTFLSEEAGAPVRTPARGVLRELDALPPPARDLVDVERYRRVWRERHGYFSMNVVATRGCPYHCNWCAKPIWGQTYHMRGPAQVAAELAELKERYGPDHVWFCDDILGLKRGWMADFAAEVHRLGARTPFKCLSRADLLLRDGEVAALARAGCASVWIGAESGSQKVLDAMDKGTRVEQIYEAARRLREAGVRVGFFLQFGYPGETRADVELTRKMVRECRPDEIGVSVSYPLPGTKFYDLVEAELGERRNWVDSHDLAMMYRGPFATAFYRQLWRVVTKEFRARLAGEEVRGALRQPSVLRPGHLRRLAALGYHRLTLPFERLWLERQARRPHRGLGPLASGMTPEEAARPTPQG